MNVSESIALRKVGAAALLASLPVTVPPSPERLRAKAADETLAALEPEAAKLDSSELVKRASAAAQVRDGLRRHSPEWIAADAKFDVLVAIEEDINPTTREEMGAGSNPPKEPAEAV